MPAFTIRSAVSRVSHGFVTGLSILAIGVQPILAQEVVPDAAATGGLNTTTAPNGVSVVDIATPNGQGLSHNTYDQFNVGADGLILNNEAGNVSQTQLGGVIVGNSNLSGSGSARVILNEVVSANRSTLGGVVEVAGQSADVIVANPNGITCNGCGFIRTPRVVLTTGTPDIAGGALQGFTVDGGDISFGANGADLSQVSLFDIISREVTFDGPVTGQDVRVTAGRNAFAYDTGAVTALDDDGSSVPGFAIDSTAVGGLYAGRISLLSTEAGVAVRAPTEMAANAGAMTLTADGRLVIGRAQASGAVTVEAEAAPVVVETSLFSEEAITLTGVSAEVAADASLISMSDLSITADEVRLGAGAVAAAGMNADGELGTSGDLAIDATRLSATNARLYATDNASISGQGDLAMTGGEYSIGGDLTIEAGTLSSSAEISTGGNTRVTASGDFTQSGSIVSGGALVVEAANVSNSGDMGSATSDATVTTLGDITNDGLIYGGRDITLDLDGDLLNDSADILAEGSIRIGGASATRAASVLNRSANIEAITGSILIAATTVENSQPVPDVIPEVTVTTREGTSADFPNVSHPSRTYRVVERVTTTRMVVDPDSNAPARMLAGETLSIDATTITNDYSQMAANEDVTLDAVTVTNTGQDLVTTVRTDITSHYTQRYCRIRFGFCWWRGTRYLTRTNTQTETATEGAVFATIEAGGTVSATVSGYLGNNAVRSGVVEQIGLSSGGRAPAMPPLIGAVNPNVILSRSALFTPSNDPNTPFLVETRSEFIDLGRFLSSDYCLDQIGGYDVELAQRRFGDAYVEARLIQEQLFALTGRRAAADPAALRALMQQLYDNALDATVALDLTPGVALSPEQVAALTDTIIWLEEQLIDGEAVLVPVVYLAGDTVDEISLASAQIAAVEIDIDAGTAVNSGRIAAETDVAINTSGDLLNVGGQIEARGDLTFGVEGRLANVSGQITGQNVTIEAGELENSLAVIRDETRNGFADRPQGDARISAEGDLTIDVETDLLAEGGQFEAGNDATIDAGGTIEIGAAQVETLREDRFAEGYDRTYTLENEFARVFAERHLTMRAGGNLSFEGVVIEAGNDADISARGNIDITSVQNIRQEDYRFDIDTGFLGVETNIRQQDQAVTTEQTTITAGGNLTITSEGGDLTLEAPALVSEGETTLSAEDGQVAILTTEDSRFQRDEFREEDLLWWNESDEGFSETTRTFTRIEAGGGLQIISGEEILVEYTATGDFREGVAQLASAPGLEWMAQLEAMDNVAWQRAETAFQDWDYEAQGLTEAGALLVSVVTSYVLGLPSIDGFITSTASNWAGSSTFLASAFEAGMRSLATQAAVSAVNNQGDLGAVLQELGSTDSLRGLVTAMVSAGLSSHLLENPNLVGELPPGATFTDQALNNLRADLIRASVNATVEAAINGGDFGEALFDGWTNAMVMAGLGAVQGRIGDMFTDANGDPINGGEGSIPHVIAHAVAGGLAAELAGEDFADGALGAAVAALAGELVGESGLSEARQVELQNLIAVAATLIASDGDASAATLAGSIAGSAHENNYLGHTELVQFRNALLECGSDDACFNRVAEEYRDISEALDADFAACETDNCRRYHLSRIEAAEQSGAFNAILNILSFNMVRSEDDFRVALNRLQYDRAEDLDQALYDNLAGEGREQLRSEVNDLMCSGAGINSCSTGTRLDLLEWGALTEAETQNLRIDIFVSQAAAQQAVIENLRVEMCGSVTGAACDSIVTAEIERQEARAARIGGVLMVVGGSLEIFAGGSAATTCATGVGYVLAAGLATHGVDTASAGAIALWTGERPQTLGGTILASAGLTPEQAELVYGFIGAGIEMGALRAMLNAPSTITPQALQTYVANNPPVATNRTGDLFDNPSQVVGSRIDELTAQIPENSRGRITMGVAVVEDAAGNRQILVSTSEPNGYLRPGVSLNDGEVLVRGPRGSHAEADIVRYAEENGLTVVDIGATRPVCTNCQSVIPDDTNITTPLR